MALAGIDIHVHIHDARARALQGPEAKARFEAMARYFGQEPRYVSVDEQADDYRSRNMKAVLLNVTDESITGIKPVPNDFVAEAVEKFSDVFFGFGIIDPWQGESARNEIYRIKDLGLHGIGEFNCARQHFYPNDRRFYPLWEAAQECELPLLFHSGYAAAGSGTPGGGGVKLMYTQPIFLDEVAADFPDLTIICAHPSWPWTAESLAIARHKPNFYIDLSGWAPKHFPDELVKHVNSLISDKALFGSDAPSMSLDRWLSDFDDITWKPGVRDKIMVGNAQKVLRLDNFA